MNKSQAKIFKGTDAENSIKLIPFFDKIDDTIPMSLSGEIIRQVIRDARGNPYQDANNPPIMPYEKFLKFYEEEYIKKYQNLYMEEKGVFQLEIDKLLYPQICATQATIAVEAGISLDAYGNEREPLVISATLDFAENERRRFPYIPAENALPMVPAGQHEDANGIKRLPKESMCDVNGNLCVTASQIGMLPQLSKIAIPPDHSVECSAGQKQSMDAIWHKANKAVYLILIRCVSPNVAEYIENSNLSGDGYGGILALKKAYLDNATVTNSEKMSELMSFSQWFPRLENPQMALAKLQTLNLSLDADHRQTESTICMIVVAALKQNVHYTHLVTSLQTMKLLEGVKSASALEAQLKKANNAIKHLTGKVNTMQSHSQTGGGKTGGGKRKREQKEKGDKPEPKCATCQGAHLAQHCAKNKGRITCNECGGPHKRNECPDNPYKKALGAGGGKRASYNNIKTKKPKNGDVCDECGRQGHKTEDCYAKACPKCQSKLYHGNWNQCNGIAPEDTRDADKVKTGKSSFLLQGASAYDLSTTLRDFSENENENQENEIVYLANALKLTAIHTGEGFPAAQKALALLRNSPKAFKASAPNESNANSHTDQIVPPSEAQPASANAANSDEVAWALYTAGNPDEDDLLANLNG
mmetsp:Transcript_21907/g.35496  ORF Transcript_21907/g.35496 Transcript_21907/m.35496 type:complete len:644 (-) Transcript_21907:1088-3019(-)